MAFQEEQVTVFRSADSTAADDAASARDALIAAGFSPDLLNDQAPGVPEGAWEVRVPLEQEAGALAVIKGSAEPVDAPAQEPDTSHQMDLVGVFEGVGTTGELEALSIQSMLQASDIPAVIMGSQQIPNLPFVVCVPRALEEAARTAIAEATAAGPAAAEEGEQATEAAG